MEFFFVNFIHEIFILLLKKKEVFYKIWFTVVIIIIFLVVIWLLVSGEEFFRWAITRWLAWKCDPIWQIESSNFCRRFRITVEPLDLKVVRFCSSKTKNSQIGDLNYQKTTKIQTNHSNYRPKKSSNIIINFFPFFSRFRWVLHQKILPIISWKS